MTKLKTTPRFVAPSDFENYTGKNLNLLLKSNSNESNKANIFLKEIEDCLFARLDNDSFRTTDWNRLTDLQLESVQIAIIKQAEYILRNSDLFTDSGYDLEKGEVMNFDKIRNISVCSTSRDLLFNCGLYSHVISNRYRRTTFL